MKLTAQSDDDQSPAIFPRVPDPQFAVPGSTMEALVAARGAIIEFCTRLEEVFGQRVSSESIARRQERMASGLDSLYVFLKRIGLEHVAGEYEELRSALKDASRGVNHPLLESTPPPGKRRSGHRDPSQICRARANLGLAIEAKHALLQMDKRKDAEASTLYIAATDILQRDNFVLALRIGSKTSRGRLSRGDVSTAQEKKSLVEMALRWRKNLSSRASNPEAAELYAVTHALIEASISKSDKETLQLVEARCLKAAHADGALNAHLEAP
jgi:hypothetical protein